MPFWTLKRIKLVATSAQGLTFHDVPADFQQDLAAKGAFFCLDPMPGMEVKALIIWVEQCRDVAPLGY
jgi:hypothetical protein